MSALHIVSRPPTPFHQGRLLDADTSIVYANDRSELPNWCNKYTTCKKQNCMWSPQLAEEILQQKKGFIHKYGKCRKSLYTRPNSRTENNKDECTIIKMMTTPAGFEPALPREIDFESRIEILVNRLNRSAIVSWFVVWRNVASVVYIVWWISSFILQQYSSFRLPLSHSSFFWHSVLEFFSNDAFYQHTFFPFLSVKPLSISCTRTRGFVYSWIWNALWV